jgi:hypothetical protein
VQAVIHHTYHSGAGSVGTRAYTPEAFVGSCTAATTVPSGLPPSHHSTVLSGQKGVDPSLTAGPIPGAGVVTMNAMSLFVRAVTGSYSTFGAACAGNVGYPTLASVGVPTIGQSFSITLAAARPNSLAVLFLGASASSWRGIPLPLDLAVYGAPGCRLYVSDEWMISRASGGSGAATLSLAVPNVPALVGGTIFNQWVVVDPVMNSAGLVLSNAGVGGIGG